MKKLGLRQFNFCTPKLHSSVFEDWNLYTCFKSVDTLSYLLINNKTNIFDFWQFLIIEIRVSNHVSSTPLIKNKLGFLLY